MNFELVIGGQDSYLKVQISPWNAFSWHLRVAQIKKFPAPLRSAKNINVPFAEDTRAKTRDFYVFYVLYIFYRSDFFHFFRDVFEILWELDSLYKIKNFIKNAFS